MVNPEDPQGAIPEEDLHALVDGRLSPDAEAALRRRLLRDPAAAALADAWRAQRDALRQVHAGIESLPLPPELLAAAERAARAHARATQWWRLGGMAASLLLAFATGWFASGQWRGDGPGAAMAAASPAQRFAVQAAVAHAVFQPEVRHPVEVPAAQQEHLVQWLSKRLDRPLKVPVLSAQGYELVGGRLLPGDDGVRAQFMYQNASGERMTLYLGALKTDASAAGETAFRFTDQGPVPGFYWVDRGFGYAIAGKLPRPALQELATAVYRQL